MKRMQRAAFAAAVLGTVLTAVACSSSAADARLVGEWTGNWGGTTGTFHATFNADGTWKASIDLATGSIAPSGAPEFNAADKRWKLDGATIQFLDGQRVVNSHGIIFGADTITINDSPWVQLGALSKGGGGPAAPTSAASAAGGASGLDELQDPAGGDSAGGDEGPGGQK